MIFVAFVAVFGFFFARDKRDDILHAIYPLKYLELVEEYSQEFGIDKYLLLAFIKTESSFNPQAKSDAEAIGLTQITEETFEWIKLKLCPDEDLVFEDLYTPQVSIRFGAYYISRCMERYDNHLDTAAAAYHSGWGTVDKLLKESGKEYLEEFPYSQMSNYVYKINKSYNAYKQLYNTENKGEKK